MKPRYIELKGLKKKREVVKRIVRAREAEVKSLAKALDSRGSRELHNFRIACKRLRYALERFCTIEPLFEFPASHLSMLQDALGETHDRDALLAILPPTMPQTERRLRAERAEYVARAAELWNTRPAIVF